ncbi:type 2 lanthipeptide synthetase LanM [Actinomyces sp. 2119]|uniref:type 2 lanthipeptide synthetase LanM n=1 Tax=Actinomyces sp. 2119 TaxID=2321393 RepID=UPI00160098EE|nr:type 2 lanthipeptide synthetase LanM [Actinomyces sp. 2119]
MLDQLVVENTLLNSPPFPALVTAITARQEDYLDQWPQLTGTARKSLLRNLGSTVSTLSLRCLLAELSRERDYRGLDERMNIPDQRLEFLTRYPVLARDLVTVIRGWRNQVSKMLTRLDDDTEALVAQGMLPQDSTPLGSVEFSGDRHDRGQSVAILQFEDGHRLVYKPRDCGSVVLYRDLLGLTRAHVPGQTALYAPEVLNRSQYGWIEYIPQAEPGQIAPEKHLRKLGALLAVAHSLGASDLHMENVIASPQGPVPVDLETLIQNHSRDTGPTPQTAAERAVSELNESVLGTGILPMHLSAGHDTSIDVSVATGGLDQIGARYATTHQVLDPLTDTMRIASTRVPIGQSRNQPPDMTVGTVRARRESLIRGFTEMSHAIMEQRNPIVKLLSSMPDTEVRCILRATRSYSLLLTEMRQPSRMHSGINRDDLFRALWNQFNKQGCRAQVIREEEKALFELDTPLFSTRLDSRSLTAQQRQVVPEYFMKTTREEAIERIKSLNNDDIHKSTNLIEESILAATSSPSAPTWQVSPGIQTAEVNAADVLRVARNQAEILLESAIFGDDDATWISVSSSTDSTGLEYQPLGPTLYDGLAGVMLATTYANRVLPGLGLDELARRSAHAVTNILEDWSASRLTLPIGAFSGVSGILYALAHFDAELGGSRYGQLKERVLHRLTAAASSDIYTDVMTGAAGAVAVITSVSDADDHSAKAALQALVQHLLAHAIEVDDGVITWETGNEAARLGGFSHGATGIGWALAKVGAALGDETVTGAARAALRFDDSLFDVSRRRWLDARPESLDQGSLYPVHWCHGTAGIAMARAAASSLLDDSTLLSHVGVGAQETVASGLPVDDSLCHGALGNLLALDETVPVLEGRTQATEITRADLETYRQAALSRLLERKPRSGLPEGVTTVRSLMLGTAGALLTLSREIDESIPNPLLLQEPARKSVSMGR